MHLVFKRGDLGARRVDLAFDDGPTRDSFATVALRAAI
jgi:hypothetical protein